MCTSIMFSKHIVWLICVFVAVTRGSDYREPVSITGSDPGVTVNGLRTGNRKWSVMESDRVMDTSNGQGTVPEVEVPVMHKQTDYPHTLRDPRLSKVAPQLPSAANMNRERNRDAECKKLLKDAQLSEETALSIYLFAFKHSCNRIMEVTDKFIKDNVVFVLIHALQTTTEDWDLYLRLLSQRNAATSSRAPAATQTSTPATTQPPSQAPTATATPTATCPTSPLDDGEVSFYRGLSEEEKNGKLIEAAKEGDVEDLRTLLAAGASPGEKDTHGRTALQWAAWSGHVEAARCLLDAGADVDTTDNEEYRPMHRAAVAGHPYVVRLLGAWGADPDAQDVSGWTPLHLAVRENRPETAVALLGAGANKEIKNESGLTPLDMAKKKNNQELIDVLTRS